MEYKMGNGDWQGGIDEFGDLAPGTYTILGRAVDDPDCVASLEVIVPNPLQECDCEFLTTNYGL